MTAIVHVANIKIRKVIFKKPPGMSAVDKDKETEGKEAVSDQAQEDTVTTSNTTSSA
jgi:hypothetical protein